LSVSREKGRDFFIIRRAAGETEVPVQLFLERALLPEGIACNVAVTVAEGRIQSVAAQAVAGAVPLTRGLALPGMSNVHSHAFQRALAGATEVAGPGRDSFWTWRDAMYRFLDRLEAADVGAIASYVYMEMLEAGYTSVGEFHYLHHQPDGNPYENPATLALAVRAAASQAGIRQVLLPTLYQHSGFGEKPPSAAQRRFILDTKAYLALHAQLRTGESPLHRTGMALHSLRAVSTGVLREVVGELRAIAPELPIHIHIAEQRREVEVCLAHSGKRPIELLMALGLVDERWCLVHATHADAHELRQIAAAQAVVGFCPSTEGNLGDGRFPLDELLAGGGRFGIGSDSQVSIDPAEELRLAEYTLRLWRERRMSSLCGGATHAGTFLYEQAVAGGAQSLGLGSGQLIPGAVADLVMLDTGRAAMAGVPEAALIDAHLFAPRAGAVRDVMVGGRWVVQGGRHGQRTALEAAYRDALARATVN
jgi:formimidoylglutamate deiminase